MKPSRKSLDDVVTVFFANNFKQGNNLVTDSKLKPFKQITVPLTVYRFMMAKYSNY